MMVLSWWMFALWAHEAPTDRLHRLETEASASNQTVLERFDLAEAAFFASDFERSQQVVDRLLAGKDIPIEVYWLHGQLLQHSGDLKGASAALSYYLKEGGRRPNARRIYAGILVAMNRLDTAGEEYAKSGELTRRPDDFLRAARLAIQTKNPDLAVVRLETGLAQLGPAVALREELVRVRVERGERELALAEIDGLLQLAPSHQGWLVLKAEVLNLGTGGSD